MSKEKIIEDYKGRTKKNEVGENEMKVMRKEHTQKKEKEER